MERIMVQLEWDSLEQVNQAAEEAGLSRAAFLREVIEDALGARLRERELDAVVASFGKSPSATDHLIPRDALRKAWPE